MPDETIWLRKDDLEALGYQNIQTFDIPVILVNGIAMKATLMYFETEQQLKNEFDPQFPILIWDANRPDYDIRYKYSIRAFKP